MNNFPNSFASREKYENYLKCLRNLKRGDKVVVLDPTGYYSGEFYFLAINDIKKPSFGSDYEVIRVLVGSKVRKSGFRLPYYEKNIFYCLSKNKVPKIEKKYVCWIDLKISKIIKYITPIKVKKERKSSKKKII